MARVRALPTGGIPYIAFITPGVIMQSVTFVSIFYGLTIVWERESGILKKLLAMPVSRVSIILGRSSASIKGIVPVRNNNANSHSIRR
ncbi:ABC transporter permease [Vulcanisaeta souniana]|nr:ABC transporter permease [Vulcanisaeta souniana]